MTTRDEVLREILAKQKYRCEVCGAPLREDGCQLAHRIPQRFIRIYGAGVIHHRLNMAAVCSLKCNSAVSVSNQPEKIKDLVRRIQE